MKVVKPSVNVLDRNVAPEYLIEKIGRMCYKSDNTKGYEQTKSFVQGLIDNKHFAMLEHSFAHLAIEEDYFTDFMRDTVYTNISLKYFTFTHVSEKNTVLMTGSIRAFKELFENPRFIRSYITPFCNALSTTHGFFFKATKPNEWDVIVRHGMRNVQPVPDCSVSELLNGVRYDISRHTPHSLHFVCDRGISHEFVRHRNCAFAQESTRYCNYSNTKFGGEITTIEPFFFEDDTDSCKVWENSMLDAETAYFTLVDSTEENVFALRRTPQEARSVLPNSLKTELVITCMEDEWQHISNLRYHQKTGAAHPQMVEIMKLAMPLLSVASNGRVS